MKFYTNDSVDTQVISEDLTSFILVKRNIEVELNYVKIMFVSPLLCDLKRPQNYEFNKLHEYPVEFESEYCTNENKHRVDISGGFEIFTNINNKWPILRYEFQDGYSIDCWAKCTIPKGAILYSLRRDDAFKPRGEKETVYFSNQIIITELIYDRYGELKKNAMPDVIENYHKNMSNYKKYEILN